MKHGKPLRSAPTEFFLVIAADTPLDDVKDACSVHASDTDALVRASADTEPYDTDDGHERFPYIVYRVTRFVKVSP
jgi:hypothetical protein